MGADQIAGPEHIFEAVRLRKCESALESLREHPEHWNARDDAGHSLLHWAALVGNEHLVAEAISQSCQVDTRCNNGQTSLMWALTAGHLLVVRQLVEAEADLQVRDSLGATPLMIATQHTGHERYQLLLLLVHRGGKELLSDVDCNGCTAVHWAAWKGDLTALKLLDGFSADLHSLDHGGMSPLHRAVMASQARVVPFLLERHADPAQVTLEGKSCFDIRQPFDHRMASVLNGGPTEGNMVPEGDDSTEKRWSEDADELGQGGDAGGDFVESLLVDLQATWLTPYYQEAVNSLLGVVGAEKKYQQSQDMEPLMGSAAPSRLWDYGDDGL